MKQLIFISIVSFLIAGCTDSLSEIHKYNKSGDSIQQRIVGVSVSIDVGGKDLLREKTTPITLNVKADKIPKDHCLNDAVAVVILRKKR